MKHQGPRPFRLVPMGASLTFLVAGVIVAIASRSAGAGFVTLSLGSLALGISALFSGQLRETAGLSPVSTHTVRMLAGLLVAVAAAAIAILVDAIVTGGHVSKVLWILAIIACLSEGGVGAQAWLRR